MRLTLDFDNKTVSAIGTIKLTDIVNTLQELFPHDWDEWELDFGGEEAYYYPWPYLDYYNDN